ncbi:MAG: AlwI family type II restriction endonuclease [Nautiliaceae bacterium]
MKLWSISTTLRNPYRFKDFLKVLAELEGKEWNKNTQMEFQIRLIQNRLYGLTNQFLKDLPKELEEKFLDFNKPLSFKTAKKIFEIKNYTDPSMRGRTSFKPLEKFGAVSVINGKVTITKLGKWILSEEFDINKFFLKSLLKWQYANPLDRDFRDFDIKPFVATLELIDKVNKFCIENGKKAKGISFWEFEIFVLSLSHYKNIDLHVMELIAFREELEKQKDFRKKERFYKEFKNEYLKDFSNKKHLRDYAGNVIRYFRLTNLLYLRGGGFYIDIDYRKKEVVEFIINNIKSSKEEFDNKFKYIDYLSDINVPNFNFEEKEFIIRDILEITNKYSLHDLEKKDMSELKQILQEIRLQKQKQIFQQIKQIEKTIENLKNYRNHPILKPSIALEKFITEALLIINDALKIKPNYISGDDGEIIFTAPAETPDIECFYQSFNSICEVTNLTSRDQWYNEGQPVMRHLRDFENKYSNSYALFVAPKLHKDTINTFWFAVKYEYEGKKQKIVPLTVSQIIEILEVIKVLKENGKRLTHLQFKEMLDEIVNVNNYSNSQEWVNTIPKIIEKYKEKLCS